MIFAAIFDSSQSVYRGSKTVMSVIPVQNCMCIMYILFMFQHSQYSSQLFIGLWGYSTFMTLARYFSFLLMLIICISMVITFSREGIKDSHGQCSSYSSGEDKTIFRPIYVRLLKTILPFQVFFAGWERGFV